MRLFLYSLLGWMPPLLQVACAGVITIFFVVTLLNLFAFILDLIPFV